MTTGCIDRVAHGSCGWCARRDACAHLFRGSRSSRRARRSEPSRGFPLLALLRHIAKAIEAQAKERSSPFRQDVERRIELLLGEGSVRIDNIAKTLGYSRQTLYRRLKREGITFEQILDAVRRRIGVRCIKEGKSVKETAYRLGFSDPSAFSRAFKRWTGSSPRKARS